ncbi:lipopolysaccharide assembly protein LapA domain-containing protein [Fictibacillus sp. KIGAM418]|uniref:Lipopolysaccharide assembly protein LapA domain-containing protein n=1 Tax=Fictibacillus marinisediminis TaxID=2878389 RepID=A0A9X1X9R1_9BACL|nr:lipopolysaccharide assembly protein LapA domain-containing protein [Fictibacillus marinisediminis]MCK6256518.1 lipopolysaccharide assembly protein LapA domain-containing protein [Fictibacillus marinisediminis]
MKAQGYLIFGLLFALLIAVFAVVNGNDVEFNYIFGTVKWPLVLIILGSAAFGGLTVGFFGILKVVQLRKKVRRLEHDLKKHETMQREVVLDKERGVEEQSQTPG